VTQTPHTYAISIDHADRRPGLTYHADTAADLLHAIARLNAVGRYPAADAAALATALHTLHSVLLAHPHDDILAPLARPVAEALRRLENCTPPPPVFA
jgi:hypothetical protein